MNNDFIVVCNGPSLADIDFKHFEGKTVLTSNRAYLSFNKFPQNIDHIHMVANELVAKQFASDLENLSCEVYTLSRFRKYFSSTTKINFIDELPGAGFSFDAGKAVFVGATVTYSMLQLAASLGAKKIYCVGLDHSFSVTDQPHKNLKGLKNDVNHYLPNYFPKGVTWQAPDLFESELNYALAAIACDNKGIKILNYTTKTNLNLFDQYEYTQESGFSSSLIVKGDCSLVSLSAKNRSGEVARMPSIGNLIFKNNFIFVYFFVILSLFIASSIGGVWILSTLVLASLCLAPFIARKIVSWVKSFRRRGRIELFFSILSMYQNKKL